jgi:hypothetical protein
MTRAFPRRASQCLLLLTGVALFGCARSPRTQTSGNGSSSITGAGNGTLSVILNVNNRSFFDVNVYVLRSPGGAGRRMGTVSGGSTATLRVPETELQPGGRLQLSVRAISGRATWISPAISVSTRVIARLDINATNSGDLTQSQLYVQQD